GRLRQAKENKVRCVPIPERGIESNHQVSLLKTMKPRMIVCLASVVVSWIGASLLLRSAAAEGSGFGMPRTGPPNAAEENAAPGAVGWPAAPAGSFGFTDTGTAIVVDTGAGLVFHVNKSNGDITSIVFNGTEFIATSGKFAQLSSGLGSATVTPETDGSTFVKLTLQTGTTGTADPNMTHYLIVRPGDNTIYMATFPGQEPNVGELRWITRLNHDLLPNGPGPSNLNDTTGAIESTDIFGVANGETRSKYYGDTITHGKDRAMDLTFCGATGTDVGMWMVFGNRESSSGGPFFRDIENQAGQDQEIYNYMNSGHNQTEANRLNVLHGPYALVFTTGAPPALPIDFSWIGNLNLMGWVSDSGRG